MKKTINIIWKSLLAVVVSVTLFVAGVVFAKRDEIVTSKITMERFSESINDYNKETLKEFVANSNNDVLYNNLISTLDNNYYYDGVSDFEFEIEDYEIFGEGKYQCYFANAFENHVPKCDLQNEGRYMNYLLDIEVSYELNGEERESKEKGLVVFVKDMGKGNYFTWKLVRFDRYKIVD